MPPRFHLRLTTSADVPALAALVEASIRSLGAQDYGPQQVESSLRFLFGIDSQIVADGTYCVVECEDEVVGCGGWSRRKTTLAALHHRRLPRNEAGADPATGRRGDPGRPHGEAVVSPPVAGLRGGELANRWFDPTSQAHHLTGPRPMWQRCSAGRPGSARRRRARVDVRTDRCGGAASQCPGGPSRAWAGAAW